MNEDRRRMMMGISSSGIAAKDINSASPGDLIINDYSTTNFLALDCSQDSVDYVYSHLSTVCPVGFCISNDNNGNVKVRSLHLVSRRNPGVGLANVQNDQQGSNYYLNITDLNNGLNNTRNMVKDLGYEGVDKWNGTAAIDEYSAPQACACLRYDPCVQSWLSNSTSVLKGYFYLPAINELLACKNINSSVTSWKALTDVTWNGIPSIRTITNAWSSTTSDSYTAHYEFYVLYSGTQTTFAGYASNRNGTLCAVMWILNGSAKHVGGSVFLTSWEKYKTSLDWRSGNSFIVTLYNYKNSINHYSVTYNLDSSLTLYNIYNGYFMINTTENSGTSTRYMISTFTYRGDSYNFYSSQIAKPHLTLDPLHITMNSNGGIVKVNVYNNGSSIWGSDVTVSSGGYATKSSDGWGYVNLSVPANTTYNCLTKASTLTYDVSQANFSILQCTAGFIWVTPQSGGLGYYVFVPNATNFLTNNNIRFYPILYYNGTNLYLVRLSNSPGYYSIWNIMLNQLDYDYISSSTRTDIINAYVASSSSITLYNRNVSNMSNDPTFTDPVSLKGQFQSC